MAWKLRTRGALNTVSSGNVSPSDIGNENDLIVAFGSYRGNAAFTEPSGWTMVAQESGGNTQVNSTLSTGSTFLAYIKRGASAPSLTFTRSGGDVAQVNLCAYYNDSAGTPTYRAADGNTVTGTESTDVSTGTFSISNGDLVVGVASIPRTDSLPFGQDITEGFLALLDTATSTSDPSTSGFRLRHYQGTSTGADNTNVVFDAVASSSNTDVVSVINFLDGGEACFPSLCAATFYLSTSTDVSTSLTGHSIALSQGNESVTGTASVSITGHSAVLSQGNESVTTVKNISTSLTGHSAVLSQGNESVTTGINVSSSITGHSLVLGQGNESVATVKNISTALTGHSIVSSHGDETVSAGSTWSVRSIGGLTSVASGNYTATDVGSQGDLVVASIAYRGSATFSAPSGWTTISQTTAGNTQVNNSLSDGGVIVAYIVRGSSAPDLVFTRTGGDVAYGGLVAYYKTVGGTITYRAGNSGKPGSESTGADTGSFSINSGDLVVGALCYPRTDQLPDGEDVTDGGNYLLGTAQSSLDPSSSGWLIRRYQSTSVGADLTIATFDCLAASGNADYVSATGWGEEFLSQCFPAIAAGSFYIDPNSTTSITGHSIVLSQGNESVTGAATVTLGGQIVSFGHGNETVSVIANVNVAVTGTLIGSSVGSVQTGNSVTTTISGTALSASLGNETVSASALVRPSGLLISSSTGSVTIAISRVWPITGQNLTTLLGGLSVTASGTVTFFVSGSAISAGIGNTAVSSDAATQVTPAVLSIISGYSSVSSGVIALLTGFIIESDVSGASVDVEVIDYLPEGGPGGELYDPSVMPVITAYEAGVAPGAELYTANQPPGSDGYTSTAQPSVSAYTPA